MISRLTAFAACFAVLSAATITFAASATAQRDRQNPAAVAADTRPVVHLPQVEVIGRRASTTLN